METINLVAGTVIAQIVKLVSKKRKARIAAPKDVITLGGMYWDGGSRTDYFVVTMRDGAPLRATQLQHTAPPQFGGPQTAPTVTPAQGLATTTRRAMPCLKVSATAVSTTSAVLRDRAPICSISNTMSAGSTSRAASPPNR